MTKKMTKITAGSLTIVVLGVIGWGLAVRLNNSQGLTATGRAAEVGVPPDQTLPPAGGYTGTYYIDSARGSDQNDGLSPKTAWKTLAKINSLQNLRAYRWGVAPAGALIRPGATFLFKRGGVWNEQLFIYASGTKDRPITFGSYGYGRLPKITGKECISAGCGAKVAWTLASTTAAARIYYADYSGLGIKEKNAVYDDFSDMIGVVTDSSKPLTFIPREAGLPAGGNLRKMERGSFMFDHVDKRLYVWTLSGRTPSRAYIEVAARKNALRMMDSSHIVVKNLEFSYGREDCVYPSNIKDVVFDNIRINTCGGAWNPDGRFYMGNGITIHDNSARVVFRKSVISDVYDSCISPQQFYRPGLLLENILIDSNEFYNCPLAGVEVTSMPNAPNSSQRGITISNNNIHNVGVGYSAKHQWNSPKHASTGIRVSAENLNEATGKLENILIKNNRIRFNEFDGILVALNVASTTIISNSLFNNKGAAVLLYEKKGAGSVTGVKIFSNAIRRNGDDYIFRIDSSQIVSRANISAQNGNIVNEEEHLAKYLK